MSISPTYIGHIATLRDAQLVFQACQDSTLVPVHRRLNDKERTAGIRSGYVYVWNDADSDIKRWTDGSCCWGKFFSFFFNQITFDFILNGFVIRNLPFLFSFGSIPLLSSSQD